MKHLIPIITLFIGIINATANTREQAYALISDHVDLTKMNVYYALISSSSLPSEVTTTGRHWVFFVDEEPHKGWPHNCTYYYVQYPSATGYAAVEANTPRFDLNLSWYKGSTYGTKENINLEYSELTQSQQNAASHVYAIILNGGGSRYMNYIRYWNDCSFIYQTLVRRYGVPKDHISVIMADGTNPYKDIFLGGGEYLSSPTDLDGDGVADIQYMATKANVVNELARMRQTLTQQDKLLVFVTDHGGLDETNASSYICLWNGERIYDYEFAAQLSGISCRYTNFVFGQCFSGGFIDDLRGHNRVIMTASAANEPSYARDDLQYDEFLYHWTTAINEADILGLTVASDSDDDGSVSMCKAFNYAQNHDTQNESPQYSSDCQKIGERSILSFSSKKWEFMIRDHTGDDGIEPTLIEDTWNSPDIIQRQLPDGNTTEHQTVQITSSYQQMFTYVKVTNIGIEDYPGDAGWFIHLYWANAIAGISLPGWLGNNIDSTTGCITGGKCLSSPIPINQPIPAGQSRWILIPWMVPYNIANMLINSGGDFHLCLLARVSNSAIGDNDNYTMGLPNDPYQTDVAGDRRIAQKNLTIYNSSLEASQGMPLYVSNLYDQDRDYSLEIIPMADDADALEHLEISIDLPDELYHAWQKGGKKAEHISTFKSQPQKLFAHGAHSKISYLKLASKQYSKIKCYSRIIADEDIINPKVYSFSIIQRDIKTGNIVGGEDFMIKQEPRNAICPQIESVDLGDKCVLKAININEPAHLTWYDEAGIKIGEGDNILLASPQKQVYTLKVESKKDGTVNYSQTEVDAIQGFKHLSPLPFSTQLDFTLFSPAAPNTSIVITPISFVGTSEKYEFRQGEAEMTVYTANYVKGTYAISLLVNGIVVDTKQIIKN